MCPPILSLWYKKTKRAIIIFQAHKGHEGGMPGVLGVPQPNSAGSKKKGWGNYQGEVTNQAELVRVRRIFQAEKTVVS